jgi:heme-degrading monooxygenase HmoA
MIFLLNCFEVFEGKEPDFLQLWQQTGAAFKASNGFIEAQLLRATPAAMPALEPRYSHINVAKWQSEANYLHALQNPNIKRLGPAYAAVCSYKPALYEVQIAF